MDNHETRFPGMDSEIPSGSLSLYDQNGATEEFPVLKAFQQYIDAEQAKARKRMISLGIFFGVLMGAVIAVFVGMLMNISQRNQLLNDRLVEFALKERDRDRQSPVVVQPPPVQQDNAAILSLTGKLEEMQKKLLESQKQVQEAETAARKAVEAATKGPSPEEKEIERLRSLLAEEKQKAAEKAAEEKRLKREQELEDYRRKHYPELYAPKYRGRKNDLESDEVSVSRRKPSDQDIQEIFDEIDGPSQEPVAPKAKHKKSVSESNAISYFDDSEEEEPKKVVVQQPLQPAKTATATPAKAAPETTTPDKATPTTTTPKKESDTPFSIPVDIKGSTSQWQIPQE